MTAERLKSIAVDAHKYGIKKALRDGISQAVHWTVACACGETVHVPGGSHSSPELMVKNMRQKGWDLREGKTPKCPSHSRKDNAMTKPVAASEVAVIPASTGPSGKILRAVYSLLEDYFDVDRMLYKSGWTDTRISKEAGTAEGVVARIREESYGKLAEEPEISKLKDDLELLTLELDSSHRKLNDQLAAFSQRIERIAAGRKI